MSALPPAVRLILPPEVSRILGVPERTLERWRRDGGGPNFCRLGGRRVAYPEQDLHRWISDRTFASRAAELAQKVAAE